MPNAKVLSEKQAVVDALVERIKGSSAGVPLVSWWITRASP